jgi:DNA-binding CsgD family transcriptional regulator
LQQVIPSGLSREDYADVEQQAYEAAIIPELWPKFLSTLATTTKSAGALILCGNDRGVHITSDPTTAPVWQALQAEGWVERNSRLSHVVTKGLVGTGCFITENDYFGPNKSESDPLIERLRKDSLGCSAGFVIDLPHGDRLIFNVEQYWKRGPFKGESLEILNYLYPHLARAAMFAGRSAFERVRTAIETLTAVGLPAAALSPKGRVILANDDFAAASLIWTTRGSDKIALHDRVADMQLQASLAAINQSKSPRSIPIRSIVGGSVTAVLQIVPIRRAAHDVFGSTCAIAVLSETKNKGTDYLLVQSLFDLTPAELSVARGLANSKTLNEIATAHNRSIATVRNQLKSIMSKTGCSRQVELVLLMQQLNQR